MNEFWQIIIGSGLSTAIVNGIFSLIRLKQDSKDKKELEDIKEQFVSQQSSIKQDLANIGHNTQYMFEFKVKIYSELNEKLIIAVDMSTLIVPTFEKNLPKDEKEKNKEIHRRDVDFCKAFNKFTKVQRKYMPFYDDNIIVETDNMIDEMGKLRRFFEYKYVYTSMRSFVDSQMKEIEMIHNNLTDNTEKVSNMIKNIFDNELDSK
ncbi:hypothetical protein [Fructilactobacillus florum]|uniref:hypothetical protein n=1 Tax=Fructilactobacillus florum TaxID=640331 RepID=UPI00028E969A|nr:hypothetical protein [Fructilactobacillus florum]EKK20155.1 hypothetical protein B807_1102 [Fructilactobacillus florum 2F]